MLEHAIEENTAAVKALTDAIMASSAERAAAVAALTATAPSAGGDAPPATRRRRTTTADKPSDETAPPPPPAPPAPPASTVPTADQVRAAAGAYLDTSDEAVRAERKLFVKAVIDHLGSPSVLAIKEEDRVKALGWFQAAKAGQKVDFNAGQDDGDDEMLG